MEEVVKFISIIRKHLLTLIVVPIISVIVTFFLVRNIPNSYISQAEVATGIVDETQQYQQQSLGIAGVLPYDQVAQQFSNLITMMKMKKIVDQVSYQLILHDLTSNEPFRTPSKEIRDLNADARAHAIDVYREMFKRQTSLNLWDPDQVGIYNVLKSMGYDSESIGSKLNIFRSGNSDFISIQFESEKPALSAMVVNTLATEFLSYYSTLVLTNKIKASQFLGILLKEKSDSLAKKMGALKTYKIHNRVLNLDEQSKQLYTSITEYDAKKQEAVQNTSSYAGALNEIDRKFSPSERQYLESAVSKINQDIVGTKNELSAMYDLYYRNDFEERYKGSIDSLEAKLSSEIVKSSDQYISNPLAAKEALVMQKIDLQVKLDISRYSINALEDQIRRLNSQFDQLVPKEAEVQSYEMGIDIASKEYIDILNKYNQTSLESELPVKLNIVQPGTPGMPQPSKKMLLVVLSGVISAFFVVFLFFILFLLDRRIVSAEELAHRTDMPVIGEISKTDMPSVDLRDIWKNENQSESLLRLKNELRYIRYEIENDLNGKVLIFESLNAFQGKTFLTMSLAFAWVMTNKKVLVIDGNFGNPEISTYVTTPSGYIEDFLSNKDTLEIPSNESSLVILKNRGGNSSLIEIASYETIREKLDYAKSFYDLILIEATSLDVRSQSREWTSFADGLIGILTLGGSFNKTDKAHIQYLKNTGRFVGWIVNKVPAK